MARIIGCHPPSDGGIQMTVARAAAAGGNSLQLFTAIPKFYGDKSKIKPDRVERFHDAAREFGIDPADAMVHAAYVLNVSTSKPDQWGRASEGLAKEMERSSLLGVRGYCFHPGSTAGSDDPDGAVERVARAMVTAIERVPDSPTRVWVENTAGAGLTVGRTSAEVAAILGHIPDGLRSRAGYGLDTCHLHASGYDIHTSEARLREILDEFEEATGEPPSFFHLNDSAHPFASNRDRHALLGEGEIGLDPFRWLLADPRTHDVPLILETPTAIADPPDDDGSADPNDEAMIALVRRLA